MAERGLPGIRPFTLPAGYRQHYGIQLAPASGAVQRKSDAAASPAGLHEAAEAGTAGPASSLPHLAAIQRSFGPEHDLSGVKAHTDAASAAAAQRMGARAYATGDHVAFAEAPDLHLAAHEAAHVIQQRAGVHLSGGVGQQGDAYEQNADAVADRVVSGQPAGDLLDAARSGAADGALQRKASLAESIQGALSAQPERAGAALQFTLADTVRYQSTVYGPPDYNGLMAAIHAAPTSERQAVLLDATLRDLVSQRFPGEWATTIMAALLEGSQQWRNPPSNDFFRHFVGGVGSLSRSSTMNCWESIMYAAYLANRVSAAWIRSFYTAAIASPDANAYVWTALGFSTALPIYGAGGAGATPRPGQLLFYHTGGAIPGHVALSLGGDEAMSLWNQPSHIDTEQRIHVGDLAGTVYIGNPPW